jgi:NADH-quinone oxidoreductase subunit K
MFLLLVYLTCYVLSVLGLLLHSQSILKSFIYIELMLASLNGMFIVISVAHDDFAGQIASLFILSVAAAESGIGLGLLIVFYQTTGSVMLKTHTSLRH